MSFPVTASTMRRLLEVGRQLALGLTGWLLLGPLTFVVPRRRGLHVFVGRDGGLFVDNCKHLFCAWDRSDGGHKPALYLTDDADLRQALRYLGGLAGRRTGARGMWAFLRAETLVVDSVDWSRSWCFAASRGARIVQLWHGIPLKEIELAIYRKQLRSLAAWLRPALRAFKKVTGRFAHLDVLLCTSQFVREQAFDQCFHAKCISLAGYPRNDVLLAKAAGIAPMIWINVDTRATAAVARHRASTRRGLVLLYAPTFRRDLADPFDSGDVDLQAISAASTELGFLLLIKLHPWMHARMQPRELPGIQFVAPDSDVYPILRGVDGLVTDYSSIYFDFLLLDRPVAFFCYDLDAYIRDDRALLFDYATMTPGPKVRTTPELLSALGSIAKGHDGYADERARVRSLVFDHSDSGSAQRLLAELG